MILVYNQTNRSVREQSCHHKSTFSIRLLYFSNKVLVQVSVQSSQASTLKSSGGRQDYRKTGNRKLWLSKHIILLNVNQLIRDPGHVGNGRLGVYRPQFLLFLSAMLRGPHIVLWLAAGIRDEPSDWWIQFISPCAWPAYNCWSHRLSSSSNSDQNGNQEL